MHFHQVVFTQKTKKNMDVIDIRYAGSRSFNNHIIYMRCSYYVVC